MVSNRNDRRHRGYLLASAVDHLPRQKGERSVKGERHKEADSDKVPQVRLSGVTWAANRRPRIGRLAGSLTSVQFKQKLWLQLRDDVDGGASSGWQRCVGVTAVFAHGRGRMRNAGTAKALWRSIRLRGGR
jgi:hypothetical protein